MAQPNYRQLASRDARQAGIDPNAFLRQINQESGFNPSARSGAGAIGIAQIMPQTAAGWHVNPNDPIAALRAAALHMAAYQRQTGSLKGALEMYNLGHVAPDSQLPAETRNYVRNILGGATPSVGGGGSVGAPAPAAPAPANDLRRQIALSLLGFGNLAGSGSDPLTAALQQAATRSNPRAATPSAPSTGPQTGGATVFDGKPVSGWIAGILAQARKTGLWKGSVTSGIRTRAQQAQLYQNYLHGGNVAAPPGQSNHETGNAVDVTDPQGLNRALQALHVNALKWAVTHGLNDLPHFSNTGH